MSLAVEVNRVAPSSRVVSVAATGRLPVVHTSTRFVIPLSASLREPIGAKLIERS